MHWLPAIQWGQASWVLPLSLTSADALAACLLSSVRTGAQSGSLVPSDCSSDVGEELAGERAERLVRALCADPALAVFALLEFSCQRVSAGSEQATANPSACPPGSLSWWDLAEWFASQLDTIFSDADRHLRTQQVIREHGEAADVSRWDHLRCSILKQSPAELLSNADAWLIPSSHLAPQAWKQTWPALDETSWEAAFDEGAWQADGDSSSNGSSPTPIGYGTSQVDLFGLATAIGRGNALSRSFGRRLRSEKLEALRELAYGLSHEINNPLAGIRTRAEHLMAEEPDESRRTKCMRIVDSVMRAHEMIADLMYFARPPVPERVGVDVQELVESLVSEYRRRYLEYGIHVRLAGAGQGSVVQADPDQLRDALRALLDNACEAVGADGEVAVEVQPRDEYLEFCVSDSGPGLSDEARVHAFDPYFSGREAGRGLGLGLCRVYRIAMAHGGGAELQSVPVGCRATMWIRVS